MTSTQNRGPLIGLMMGLVCLSGPAFAAPGSRATDLRFEHLASPLGVDEEHPRLSWRLQSDGRGQEQTAYHILVASSRQKIDGNTGDLWDSGKVAGNPSLNVVYGDVPLQSRYQYFWKVIPYLVHDVTDHIASGENTIGVILGNGYFNPVIPSLLRDYVNDRWPRTLRVGAGTYRFSADLQPRSVCETLTPWNNILRGPARS